MLQEDSTSPPGAPPIRNGINALALPLGAMSVPAPAPSSPDQGRHHSQSSPSRSPEARPDELPHVQYAKYSNGQGFSNFVNAEDDKETSTGKAQDSGKIWVPTPLKTWFWILLAFFMVAAAIGLEVALAVSKHRNGWPTKGSNSAVDALHYAYTIPPVAVAMVFTGLWAWTDIEIKKMQPYVSLAQGNANPKTSLMLDYTRTNNFLVWISAMRNSHWLVGLATLMVILSLCFQPLAGALLTVKPVWLTQPGPTMQSLASLGLNQNTQFDDLTYFLGAVSYASSSVIFNLGNPPFVYGTYAVAPFQLPTSVFGSNGTVHANTTAVKTNPGCQPVSVNTVQTGNGGWNNSATFNGCSASWTVNQSSPTLFGTTSLSCSSAPPQQFAPVVFWFFTYDPQEASSATYCFPSISFVNVNVDVDLSSGNVTSLSELGPVTSSSNFSSFSGNLTGDPLDGRAYNGIAFNISSDLQSNPFIQARQQAIQLQMPAAVAESATQSSAGLFGTFLDGGFTQMSSQVYQMYLNMVASKVYYLSVNEDMYQAVSTFQNRLFLADVAVHLLAVAMLMLVFFGSLIHILHRWDRRLLRLRHAPGTIASAVSIGAQTTTGALIDGRQEKQEMYKALGERRFRINPQTMKIVMEGEDGYEYAASPDLQKRKSILRSITEGRQRASLWLSNSTPSGLPKSPLPQPGSTRSRAD